MIKELFKMGFVLLVVSVVAGLALGAVYEVAWPKIVEQKRLARERALKEVMPDAESSRKVEDEKLGSYYEGLMEGAVICYAKEVSVKGYGGKIDLMVGIANDESVCGVKVLSHSETPGLGARIGQIRFGEDKPWFLQQFLKKELADLEVVKQPTEEKIEAITGATISSTAVTNGVRQVLLEISQADETK